MSGSNSVLTSDGTWAPNPRKTQGVKNSKTGISITKYKLCTWNPIPFATSVLYSVVQTSVQVTAGPLQMAPNTATPDCADWPIT